MREKDILISADDDKLLRKIGIEGRILTTPGHCVDHIAIVLDNGDTFCGDAAASFLLTLGTRYCTVFMTDMEEAYRSWQKLLDARAQVIYPGHGKAFSAEKLKENMGKFMTKDLIRFY
jgi:glyoxylase-like metal-dependent hydrolase (beta-lactamase superfamily II)